MNWTDFVTYLFIAYLIYYGINVIVDLLRPQHKSVLDGEGDILEFSEAVATTIVEEGLPINSEQIPDRQEIHKSDGMIEEWIRSEADTEELNLISENVNVSSGGVSSMQELMKLAQDKSIEVKKQLVF